MRLIAPRIEGRGDLPGALRALKKLGEREGIGSGMRRHRAHEKPSARRARKRRAAIKLQRKETRGKEEAVR